jgi:hypothetical protein
MVKPLRNVLVLAALCWVAPLGARQAPAPAAQPGHSADCPDARAKAAAISVPGEGSLFYLGRSAAFAP